MDSHCTARAPEREQAGGCWVAMLELPDLAQADGAYTVYLSAPERERFDAIRSAQRRREWLGGRLAAKYLFLYRLELGFEADADRWRPALLALSSESLRVFPAWMYEAIEIRPSTDAQGGAPRLVWLGGDREQSISVSHTRNVACACLAEGVVGVDLEMAEPRVETFYRSNYTDAEKAWVDRCAREERIDEDWLYTLLWTCKESALKARALHQQSALSFAGIDVSGLPAPRDVRWAYLQGRFSDRCGLFTAVIQERCRATSAQVAYMGTRDLILTVLKPSAQTVN